MEGLEGFTDADVRSTLVRTLRLLAVLTAIGMALVLPAACLIGGVGGAALDKHFHTGWIGVTGILLGATAGFVQIYRAASKHMKRDD